MTRALLTGCNRGFFPGAVALLASALRHHPDVPRFCMVPPEDEAMARSQMGHLAKIITPPRLVQGVSAAMQPCVYRLFAVTLPFDRVAYVDSDAIMCRPAPELWETEPGKWNVIQDTSQKILHVIPAAFREAFSRQFPGVGEKKGFNSGVLGLAPSEWLDLPERFERVLLDGEYPAYHPVFDQALLNGMLQGQLRWLPFGFNVHNLFDNRIPKDARIIHFTGGVCKPWDSRYSRQEPQYLYWLRHGLGERGFLKLFKSRLLVTLAFPKRWIGRKIRHRREGRTT